VTEPILEVEGVVKSFGGLRAVDGAAFSVARGSVTALIGPNGAGKTTLFNVLTGFYRPDQGRIAYAGQPIHRKPPYAIARRGMIRTFQITKVLSGMSVLDNMLLGAPRHPGERLLGLTVQPRAAGRREREARDRAFELLDLFNLREKADDYAGTLSGGQRKLLELARSLMVEPKLVLLDEPMAGVNPTLGQRLLVHIEQLRREQGITFLFVEHDMDVVMTHADRVIVMAQGQVIAEGPPEEIRNDERVLDAYLGRSEPAA
jgi:neutral amino acid transport system ATP-binding protein